ncbi:MAG: choice-of-anchor J domain-containing protein [Crocinitomicaceae bacterium]|nr:choice-of-anchor J domain-containing protein [Crocinitomicaceae bacterium]
MKKIGLIIGAIVVLVSCKKEYDTPPLTPIPETPAITIDSLRDWQNSIGGLISIDQELSVHGIITMDETDGNIYKNVYLQDATGAINVRILSGGGLYQGDSVRVYLKGTVLNKYNGILQLDSVDVDNNVVKLDSDVDFAPLVTTIDQITPAIESQLVKLENVQFVAYEIGNTYADKDGLQSVNILLEDCSGNTIIVRTSGYASFADELIASGNGSLTAIASHFNGTELQLYIRAFDEINMTGARCPGIVFTKTFDDDLLLSGGWSEIKVTGTTAWETSSAGGAATPYASISNWNGSVNVLTENWLISPSIDLTPYGAPTLSFDNAKNYSGPALEVLISTNYVSGAPSTGTWTNLSPALSSGAWAWINSGELSLSAYIQSNVHIAFKYTGTASDGSTWEIDNIKIKG